MAAGLPNIVGDIGGFIYSLNGSGAMDGAHGAFVSGGNLSKFESTSGVNSAWYDFIASFNASRSNPCYGNAETVQPPALQLIPQIRY